ncbi:hypothetical protein Tco_0496229 [Tanacetum coccineum]
MAAACAYEETERANVNCTLENNLQQASTSGTQSDKAPIDDSDGSAENDSNVIYEVSSVKQGGRTVEQHSANVEETRAYHESLFHNLAAEVEKVNSVNRKMKETNANLTIELARYKNQEKCFEISQEKYDKLERCKQITDLNEEISNLNNQLSKEKSIVSSLQEEKKRLKSDFKIREDELLDKQIQLENKIKELDNILVKMGQSIQTMHMLSPKPDSFYHTKQKMALGYQNPFYLKQAQQEQQSLYNGKVLLGKHDPPDVYDSEETLELAQEKAAKFVRDFNPLAKEADESFAKHKALELEIERLLRAVVSQDIMSVVQNPTVLQAPAGDPQGKCKDTPCVSDTLDPLSQKLKNENVELEFHVLNYAKENAHLKTTYKNLFDSIYVSEQKDTTKGMSVNTQFKKQSILGKPPSSSGSKLYSVTPFPKSKGLPKIDETHALSNPVTSNSVPTTTESKVMTKDKVIAPGMFRINSFKTSREDKFVLINKVRASVKTKMITVSQPYVLTKKVVNSNSNGLSSTRVDNTTKTRRPQPRSNTKNDRVPSALTVVAARIKKLMWSPTGRIFDLKGKIIDSSESESQSNCSNGDNACISNPQEPTRKRFPNSTFSLADHSNLCMVRRLDVLKAHDRQSEASHKFRPEVLGNRPLWK